MLRELLALMDSGGALTRESMARALGIGAPEVEDMLDRLVALGYIEEANGCDAAAAPDGSCSDGRGCCSACASCSLCAKSLFSASQARIWRLSAKGRQALA